MFYTLGGCTFDSLNHVRFSPSNLDDVRIFYRKKWIPVRMVPHFHGPSCCCGCWCSWLYLLQIQTSGMSCLLVLHSSLFVFQNQMSSYMLTKHCGFCSQSYMDSEIMAIMSQYMPLDNNHNNEVAAEAQPLRHGSSV